MLHKIFYSFLLRFSVPIFGLGNFVILVRIFDQEQIGIWALFTTLTSLIEVSKTGLINNATIKYLNSSGEESNNVIQSASLMINILFTGLIIILIWLSPYLLLRIWDSSEMVLLLKVFTIHMLVLIIFHHLQYLLGAKLKFKHVLIAFTIRNGFLFLAILIAHFAFHQLDQLVILVYFQLVGLILATVVMFILARQDFLKKMDVQWQWVRQLLNFGKYSFGTSSSSIIFRNMEQYMVASLINLEAAALYNASLRITNLMDLPSTAVANVLFPISVKDVKDKGKESLKRMYELSVGRLLAFVFPIILFTWIFAHPIMTIISGDKYQDAVPILQVTLFYVLLLPFLKMFGTVVDVLGTPKKNFRLILVVAITNIICGYFFIQFFGILGAAYATLFSYILSVILGEMVLHKELNVNLLKVFYYWIVTYKDIYHWIRNGKLPQR